MESWQHRILSHCFPFLEVIFRLKSWYAESLVDIYPLFKRRVSRYHSLHLILLSQRYIIQSPYDHADQVCTGQCKIFLQKKWGTPWIDLYFSYSCCKDNILRDHNPDVCTHLPAFVCGGYLLLFKATSEAEKVFSPWFKPTHKFTSS